MHRWAVFGTTTVWTVLYALMVGTPISILRAGFMYLLMQSAPLFFRRGDTCNSLCIAGVLMTIGNPYLIQDASFLLSFVGTFGIGVFAPLFSGSVCGIAHCEPVFGTHLFRDAGIVTVDFSHRRCGICGKTSLLSAEAAV